MENAIRFVKKFYFWPVCLIALGLALFFWSSSIGALDKEFASNESKYLQSKSSVDNIPSNPPNERMIQAIGGRKNLLMQNVYRAWTLLYNKQNENNTWPEIVINERKIDFNADFSGNDNEPYREQYLYRIVEEFRKMIATLNLVPDRNKDGAAIDDDVTRVNAGADAQTPESGNAATPTDSQEPAAPRRELVVWAGSDIDKLIENHFSWKRIPTPLQIRVAQEDFWIFQNIINAIKTLNEGVDNRSAASLREIRSFLITNDAVDKFQERLEKGFFDEKNFSKTSSEEGGEGSEEAAPEASAGGEGGEVLKKEFRELYDMRYVDQDGRGLSAEQFNALNNVEVAGINTSKIRRVPIYLSLVIKQNRLSDLMAALTNAEKPVEIKLVVINPGQGWTPTFNFSQFESENPEGEENAQNEGASRGRGGKSSRRGSSRNTDRSRSSSNDLKLNSDEILVDIYGVINLFNVPSMDIFPGLSDNLNGNDADGGALDDSEDNGDPDNSSDDGMNDNPEE